MGKGTDKEVRLIITPAMRAEPWKQDRLIASYVHVRILMQVIFLVTDWRVICYLLSFPSIETTHGNVGKILELKRHMENLITVLTRT